MSKNLSSSKHENQRKQSSKEFEGKFVCDVQSRQNSAQLLWIILHENPNIVTWVNVLMDDTTEYRRPTIQGVIEYDIFYQICDQVSHMQKEYFLESSALKLTL